MATKVGNCDRPALEEDSSGGSGRGRKARASPRGRSNSKGRSKTRLKVTALVRKWYREFCNVTRATDGAAAFQESRKGNSRGEEVSPNQAIRKGTGVEVRKQKQWPPSYGRSG